VNTVKYSLLYHWKIGWIAALGSPGIVFFLFLLFIYFVLFVVELLIFLVCVGALPGEGQVRLIRQLSPIFVLISQAIVAPRYTKIPGPTVCDHSNIHLRQKNVALLPDLYFNPRHCCAQACSCQGIYQYVQRLEGSSDYSLARLNPTTGNVVLRWTSLNADITNQKTTVGLLLSVYNGVNSFSAQVSFSLWTFYHPINICILTGAMNGWYMPPALVNRDSFWGNYFQCLKTP
jgi:hypothetical protein